MQKEYLMKCHIRSFRIYMWLQLSDAGVTVSCNTYFQVFWAYSWFIEFWPNWLGLMTLQNMLLNIVHVGNMLNVARWLCIVQMWINDRSADVLMMWFQNDWVTPLCISKNKERGEKKMNVMCLIWLSSYSETISVDQTVAQAFKLRAYQDVIVNIVDPKVRHC